MVGPIISERFLPCVWLLLVLTVPCISQQAVEPDQVTSVTGKLRAILVTDRRIEIQLADGALQRLRVSPSAAIHLNGESKGLKDLHLGQEIDLDVHPTSKQVTAVRAVGKPKGRGEHSGADTAAPQLAVFLSPEGLRANGKLESLSSSEVHCTIRGKYQILPPEKFREIQLRDQVLVFDKSSGALASFSLTDLTDDEVQTLRQIIGLPAVYRAGGWILPPMLAAVEQIVEPYNRASKNPALSLEKISPMDQLKIVRLLADATRDQPLHFAAGRKLISEGEPAVVLKARRLIESEAVQIMLCAHISAGLALIKDEPYQPARNGFYLRYIFIWETLSSQFKNDFLPSRGRRGYARTTFVFTFGNDGLFRRMEIESDESRIGAFKATDKLVGIFKNKLVDQVTDSERQPELRKVIEEAVNRGVNAKSLLEAYLRDAQRKRTRLEDWRRWSVLSGYNGQTHYRR